MEVYEIYYCEKLGNALNDWNGSILHKVEDCNSISYR